MNQSETIQPVSVLAGETHLGLVRGNNEDSFLYCAAPDDNNALAVVADGIGGLAQGEVASWMCCKHLLDAWQEQQCASEKSLDKLCDFLRRELVTVNRKIFDFNRKKHRDSRMGTTVVAAIISQKNIIITHAGDSRLYRLRRGHLNPLTEDHSFLNAIIRKKLISYKEAEKIPFAHVIMKSLGTERDINLDVDIFNREPDDCYMLCSDGITTHLSDYRIEQLMNHANNADDAVDQLMRRALIKGGHDNITVVCCYPEHWTN